MEILEGVSEDFFSASLRMEERRRCTRRRNAVTHTDSTATTRRDAMHTRNLGARRPTGSATRFAFTAAYHINARAGHRPT